MCFPFLKTISIHFILINIFFITFSYSQKKNIDKEPFYDTTRYSKVILEKYIYFRNKNDKLKINKKNLKTIYKNTKSSEDYYFDVLRSFSMHLSSDKNKTVGKNLSFSEQAFVHAYAIEYLYKCQENL